MPPPPGAPPGAKKKKKKKKKKTPAAEPEPVTAQRPSTAPVQRLASANVGGIKSLPVRMRFRTGA